MRERSVEIRIGITHRAMRRYIERVVGLRINRSLTDYQAIAEFEAQTGTHRNDLYKIIHSDVTPRLPITVLNRGTRRVIKGENARYIVDEGKVVTCYTADQARDYQEGIDG
jgi:hypothetical protein